MRKHKYKNNCIDWPKNDIEGLIGIIANAVTIQRPTFLRKIDTAELHAMEKTLGYENHHTNGLTMAADPYVSYFKSIYKGKEVYGFKWSAIEYVFTAGGK